MFDSEIYGLVIPALFEGDDDDGAAGDGAVDDGKAKGGKGSGGSAKVVFDDGQQAHINTLLAQQKRTFQANMDKLTQKLADGQLTAQQRDELAQELEVVRASLRTKEEQTEHDKTKLIDGHKLTVTTLTSERDDWQKRYTRSTISRSLLDAASEAKAVRPQQVEDILQSKTILHEETDKDGKKTGQLVPMVKLSLPDKTGKLQELFLPPIEMVKRMKEAPVMYGNLFQSDAKGGTGATGGEMSGKEQDLRTLGKDPEAYRKARKEGKVGS